MINHSNSCTLAYVMKAILQSIWKLDHDILKKMGISGMHSFGQTQYISP